MVGQGMFKSDWLMAPSPGFDWWPKPRAVNIMFVYIL